MKLTGYQIREALRRWGLQRDAASALFDDTLKRFEDENDKPMPATVMASFQHADSMIALIQVAQDRYNLGVEVEVRTAGGNKTKMTLAEAVKRVGGVGRCEKMWRSAANPKKDRYAYRDENVRKEGETHPKPSMPQPAMLKEADTMARYASSLREAIALGNGTSIDIEVQGLESSAFA